MTRAKMWRAGSVLAVGVMLTVGARPEASGDSQGLGPQLLQVEGKGMVQTVAGTCPSVVLTILGIPVTVGGTTTFAAGQSCQDLSPNDVVEVRGTLTVVGGSLSVVANTIEIEDGGEVEGEGRVTALSGTCPDLTLTVDGITVTTDALTRFAPPAVGCGDLRVGTKVKVKAVPAPGGGYRARLVTVKGQRQELSGESRITSVTGGCPDKSIFFGDVEVRVNAGTRVDGGTCDDLAAGVRAEVFGIRDDGGPITAMRIKIKGRHVRGASTVSQIAGTCPTLTLTVHGVTVNTGAATQFEGGSCGNIRVGTRVEVEGDWLNEDGRVIAEKVEIEDQPGGSTGGPGGSSPITSEGTAATVTGTCPTKTFVMNGVSVITDAATVFDDGPCSALVSGARVEVTATRLANGTYLASKIDF
jgi:hypothetical protein